MKGAVIVLLAATLGCSKEKDKAGEPDCCCSGGTSAPAVTRPDVKRPGNLVMTGLPESANLGVCDTRGRWGVTTPAIEHSIVDAKAKDPLLPVDGHPTLTLFRDSIPFPQFNWKSGDWEVTQLLFPVAKGFAARYHVMNHGEESRTGKLRVGAADGPLLAAAGQPAASSLQFDLKVEPGVSQFFFVTTPDLAGKVSEDDLEQATAQWEKLIGKRALKLPDEAVVTQYYADLAGQILGVSGCAEATAKVEAMLVRKEGNALHLLAGIPDAWTLESIEVREIPSEFGPVSFRYQGAYNNRTFELLPGASPPGGYKVAVPQKLVARIDGKDAKPVDGVLGVPSGARFVEVSYPR